METVCLSLILHRHWYTHIKETRGSVRGGVGEAWRLSWTFPSGSWKWIYVSITDSFRANQNAGFRGEVRFQVDSSSMSQLQPSSCRGALLSRIMICSRSHLQVSLQPVGEQLKPPTPTPKKQEKTFMKPSPPCWELINAHSLSRKKTRCFVFLLGGGGVHWARLTS